MLLVKTHMENHHIVIESSPGVFYSGPVGNFILPEKGSRVRELDYSDKTAENIETGDEIETANEEDIGMTMCQQNICQTSREMQLHQTSGAQDKRRVFAAREWKSLNAPGVRETEAVENNLGVANQQALNGQFCDPAERAEALILRRDSLRHIGDWFYPEGGWGWNVALVCLITNVLSMGLVMSQGQVMVLSINARVGEQTNDIKTGNISNDSRVTVTTL